MKKEKPFSYENKETPPLPGTLDLIILDGRFAQCINASRGGGMTVMFIEDRSVVSIPFRRLYEYKYEKPPRGIFTAIDLVKDVLMSEKQLKMVHWGPEQKKHPYLREEVAFFGTYTKKD